MMRSSSLILFALTAAIGLSHLVAEDFGFGYERRDGHIYFEGGGKTGSDNRIDKPSLYNILGFSHSLGRLIKTCSGLDVASFRPLSVEYSRDNRSVYYKWISPGRFLVVKLPQADVATFKPLNLHYAQDQHAIWYADQPILGSDAASANLIYKQYIKDANHVYVSGQPQAHLEAATFQHLASAYFIDSNGIYWGAEKIDGADAKTFKVLGDSFVAVDAVQVYRSGKPLPHLDPATCRLIQHDPYGHQVLSDKKGVYLNGLKFQHAIPSDFEMIDLVTGKGGKYVFLIDRLWGMPVTLYREEQRLIAETIVYAYGTTRALARMKAEVTQAGLKKIERLAPSGKKAIQEVPSWQIENFKRADLVALILEAKKHLPAAK